MINFIRKRTGQIVSYDSSRITDAIFKAAVAVGGTDYGLAVRLTKKVEEELVKKFGDGVPTVEEIQDIVEKVLIENGHAKTAKAYILYRDKKKFLRETKNIFLDVLKVVDGYVCQGDWRVNENSNSGYSFSGLLMHAAGEIVSHYTLEKIYPEDISKAHRSGDMHIHDLSMGIAGYCAGWSLKNLLYEGFGGVPNKVEAAPAKHFSTALGQMVNFLGTLQNEWAGAQAFSSFDTYLAPFVYYDGLSYKEIKQEIQKFIFSLNVSSRWGGQTPFTNLTFDLKVPEDLKEEYIVHEGKIKDKKYKEFQKEMDLINKAFLEVMYEGDAKGRIFTFPIPTYNITKDFEWNSEISDLLFKVTGKYGYPYFQNFVNSDLKPSDVRSMCCRLQLDLRELKSKTNGIFGAGESTGSLGVVTLNLPRIGYISKTKEQFFANLDRVLLLAFESLEIKRDIVQKNLDSGLFPYTNRYLGTLEHHFSTIGIIGMNEALYNFMRKNIYEKDGIEFALEIIYYIKNKLKEFQKKSGHLYNLEATPAEGTSYRLAKLDKEKYPDIITASDLAIINGNKVSENVEPYYTNSTLLPVFYSDDIYEALEHQNIFQPLYTGGTVFHIFVGEEISDYQSVKVLIKKVCENYKIPYFSVTPTFSVCPIHGYIRGKVEKCEICGSETEIYSRVVGYYRPVNNWNKGKKEEFFERKTYNYETIIYKESI
ncbi:MAG: ribonucleoside triphosphate reductase [Spirochaetes bacterium]|nr:ribonucleoside triphosphate reductase [Spirochaetota bacterium]